MKLLHSILIFCYGCFTIAAQSLLFREFLTTFKSNDISIGLFFASWFMWIGIGAIIIKKIPTLANKVLSHIELLFLSYLPAFLLELVLIMQGRELLGIESYALLPISTILLLSILVNAPLCLITGMLFPTSCRWIKDKIKLPISKVYLLEAVGSLTGGIAVTLLLATGTSLNKIFLILTILLSAPIVLIEFIKSKPSSKLKIKAVILSLIPLLALLALATGIDKTLTNQIRIAKWSKLLPAESFQGSFHTSQAEYLYGIHQDQFTVLSQNSVFETIPAKASSGHIAAINLSQNPNSKNILVIGSGLGVCQQFLQLPQIETVTWVNSDNEYGSKINQYLPEKFQIKDKRFNPHPNNARSLLSENKQIFDIVIINLPDATNSVINRYYTVEFYSQIKKSLSPDGVLSVRISGGENIMGTELLKLGATTKLTLEKIFSNIILTPGENTWFIASDSENLTDKPGTLRDRFAKIHASNKVFPPDALFSIFLPERAALAMKNYSKVNLPNELLINRDAKPLSHLYSLLLTAKQSGTPIAKFFTHLTISNPIIFFIPILAFLILRGGFLFTPSPQKQSSTFDSIFLVFSAGTTAVGIIIILMYLYQTRFGSLYLHIGMISSLFMLGLIIGVTSGRMILPRLQIQTREFFLLAIILINSLVFCAIAFWPNSLWTHSAFAIFFILCGLCSGCYFPIAVQQLNNHALGTIDTACDLETADHLGSALGGILVSLFLIPVIGVKWSICVLLSLLSANLFTSLLRAYKREPLLPVSILPRMRTTGYILFAIGIVIVICSNIIVHSEKKLKQLLPEYTAQSLAGQLEIKPDSSAPKHNQKINYYRTFGNDKQLHGYIFSSQELAPEINGFGGTMNLAVYVDVSGKLIDFHIISSQESPSYLSMLTEWSKSLNTHELFKTDPFQKTDAVSGATVSSKAILTTLETSAHRFASEILGKDIQANAKNELLTYGISDKRGVYLIFAFLISLVAVTYGGAQSRFIILGINFIIGGMILNAQYSCEQIATLCSLYIPAINFSGSFLLIIGIPILVMIFGNIYCGYICPFGALQEFFGLIIPDKLKPSLKEKEMGKARFVKYIILFIILATFFISRDRTILASDPLISVFNFNTFTLSENSTDTNNYLSPIILIIIASLIGSIYYPRFWCRYLCPSGAFLSLLNKIILLKQFWPSRKFGACKFGLTNKDHLDCIYCKQCRIEKPLNKKNTPTHKIFFALVFAVAILTITITARNILKSTSSNLIQNFTHTSSAGKARDLNLKQIKKLIREKKLSNKESLFYKKIKK